MTTQTDTAGFLESYISFADFLTNALGAHSGAIVYNVNADKTDGQIIGLSGSTGSRTIGDSMTVLVKRILQKLKQEPLAELTHVDTEASTADGRIKFNFYPIRIKDEIIGIFILCMKIDLLCDLRQAIDQYLGASTVYEPSKKLMNAIDDNLSLTQYMNHLIHEKIHAYSVPVEQMTIDEKKAIVHDLEKDEVFFVKDSVRTTAVQLGISVPTLYRLLKQP